MNEAKLLQLRETKLATSNINKINLDGSFSGYASIFEEPDLGNDVVAKGAFAGSLKKRGPEQIKMLFQHNPDEPIGVWKKIEETERGLFVKGQITTSVSKGAEILELLRAGAVDGLSIGFWTIRARQERSKNIRRILEADLWEISIVTFPMQESARVHTVKSYKQNALKKPSIREFERWLVRDAGLTRADAKTVITKGYSHIAGKQAAASKPQELAERIRVAAKMINPNF